VRFEDLVRDPAAARRRILAFIGEDDALCPPIGQDLPQTGTLEHSSTFAHHANLKKAISAGKIGVYKNAFAPRQIELFEAVAGEWLTRHGYVRDFAQPLPPTRLEKMRAFLFDHTIRYIRKFFQPGAVRQIPKELKLALQQRFRTLNRRAQP
jgi:hypothetical protein